MNNKHPEYQYLDLLTDILENGSYKEDRTGTGTYSVFGRQIRFDLSRGFPLLTTKKVYLRAIIHELLWFLAGDSNIQYLVQNNVRIWNEWPYRFYKESMEKEGKEAFSIEKFIEKVKKDEEFAKKWGELGPVYGAQWRRWPVSDKNVVDQITKVIQNIKDVASGKDYSSARRLIISAWNAAHIEEMAKAGLPPCHTLFQFYVLDGKLSCQLYQRSADMFLGVPFNIASYALLTVMVAHVTNLEPGDFVHTFGDAHIYKNHIEQVKEQLQREPKKFPQIKLNPEITSIFDFTYEDFELENYDPHPPIKAPVAI